tara:strand:+ start:206 stop:367 length:162 start_codon:yes stop_codon:yes gene_type:complete
MREKSRKNPNWGGARKQSELIKKYADQWCVDNGYPITERIRYRGRRKSERTNL